MLPNNWLALVITLVLAVLWLRVNDFLAHRGMINSRLSRKIIHIGTGPIFVLCWLLFRDEPGARYLAALVPLAITIQFFLVGTGILKDQSAVDAMSRKGDRAEILRGPLYYGLVFVALTIIYWKDSPTGMIALMVLCGGDGVADIVGKCYGRTPIPWSKNKTVEGSLSVFLGGWIFATLILAVFLAARVFPGSLVDYLPGITIISLVVTLVESLPFHDIDNLTVPAAAALLGYFFFP